MVINLRVNVNSQDLQRIYRKLDMYERTKRLRAGMMESQQYLQAEIQTHMAVDSSRGRSSVLPSPIIGSLPSTLRGTVGSAEVHVLVMEQGRRPGSRMPPIGPIRLWMYRHGVPADREFLVRRAIARRGLWRGGTGLRMFRNAARNGRRVITAIITRHLRGTT